MGLFIYIVRDVFKEQKKFRRVHNPGDTCYPQSRSIGNYGRQLTILFRRKLKPAAIIDTGDTKLLYFLGCGADHHIKGKKLSLPLRKSFVKGKGLVVAKEKSSIGCPH